jgi:uncharacterized protein (TIGR00251 family)
MTIPSWAHQDGNLWTVRVKAVPGSSRNRIQGALGDHLKVQVAAPPEGGKANAAIRELLGAHFGVPQSSVELQSGHTSPRKIFRIKGGQIPKISD